MTGLKRIGLLFAGVGAFALSTVGGSALAAAPQATAPAADVATLESEIQAAIASAVPLPGQTEEDAMESAIAAAIQNSGFDAVTALAALQALSKAAHPATTRGTASAQAERSLAATYTPLAQQEIQMATASGGGGSSGGGGGGGGVTAGSSGGGGGGGGYVVSH